MSKTILKFIFISLLLLCFIAVPVVGVSFYDSPGLSDADSILSSVQFGGGSSVYMVFQNHDGEDDFNTPENLAKGAEVLEARFRDRGFTDAKASVQDGMIRLDFAQKSYVESVISQVATIGNWSFVGSDMSKSLCDASYVKDARVKANPAGGYGITLEFTEEGANEFYAATSSYAVSGSSFYLMVDGQLTAIATVSSNEVKDSFTFGQYQYDSAAVIASFIKHGELPEHVEIEKIEPLQPSLGTTLLTVIYTAAAVIILACAALLILRGRSAGIFAAFGILADVAILCTALLNGSFQLNFTTLITVLVLLILAGSFSFLAISPIGKSLKDRKMISTDAMSALSKYNVKCLWIHGVIIAVILICHLFANGSFLYLARIVLIFTCANAVTYFLFLYFGVATLAEAKKQ